MYPTAQISSIKRCFIFKKEVFISFSNKERESEFSVFDDDDYVEILLNICLLICIAVSWPFLCHSSLEGLLPFCFVINADKRFISVNEF